MKHFKTISIAFISAIVVIFGCHVYYLSNLYQSIRGNTERDVKTALADADIDELWIRANQAQSTSQSPFDPKPEKEDSRHGEISVGLNDKVMVSSTQYADGSIERNQKEIATDKEGSNLTNEMLNEVGKQFHAVMDPYVPVNLSALDSVLTVRLNERYIYPDYVSVEIVNGKGEVVTANPGFRKGDYDVFTYCANPELDLYYRAYLTPLIRHILTEMAGVIITVLLLMTVFTWAFIYLFYTVSRLRTIEEMKDDFINNMTHELKTPIAVAYSANDALLNYDLSNDPAKKETYLKIANKQLKRLGELVEHILAMSMERRKSLALKREPISLRPFIEEIIAMQLLRKDKGITIHVEPAEEVVVEADPVHLANIFNNLIDNAIKYSGEAITMTIRYDANGVSFADNGIGIPEKSIPFLFNKFYRVPHGNRQDVRGYGIGLYYVKSLLDKMGWSISVKSKENEGSVFTIKFRDDEK